MKQKSDEEVTGRLSSNSNSCSNQANDELLSPAIFRPGPYLSTQYANSCLSWIIKGLNDYDLPKLRTILLRHCITGLVVINHSYDAKIAGRRPAKNSFQTTMRLQGIEPFIQYWSIVQAIIPDGFYHIQDIRSCETYDEQSTSLFMSVFEFSGTNIRPNLSFIDYHAMMELQATISNSRNIVDEKLLPLPVLYLPGSLGIYFNAKGFIYCLEFYYQRKQ